MPESAAAVSRRTAPVLEGGSVELDAAVFTQKFNMPLVHEAVRGELAALRRGTASTKTRGKVSGGNQKPWRQKGTGRARVGSSRSPIWTGGGTVFGPSPRHYTFKINRKARRSALRAALSVHAERESIAVFDASAFDAPSTKQAKSLLDGWGPDVTTLVVLEDTEWTAAKSFGNLPTVVVLPAEDAGVANIIGAKRVLVSQAALPGLVARAGGEDSTDQEEEAE
jgi:large subunit ribosomal protein L4